MGPAVLKTPWALRGASISSAATFRDFLSRSDAGRLQILTPQHQTLAQRESSPPFRWIQSPTLLRSASEEILEIQLLADQALQVATAGGVIIDAKVPRKVEVNVGGEDGLGDTHLGSR